MQHLLHILEVCQAPFLDSPPVPSQYADPIVDATAVFPLLSKLLGNANYTTDTKQPKKASDSCWKESYGHPSLFLGISLSSVHVLRLPLVVSFMMMCASFISIAYK